MWLLCYGFPREVVKTISLDTVKHKTSWTKAQENVLQRKCSSQKWCMRTFPSLNYLFSGWCFTVILFFPSGTTHLPPHSDPKRWCILPKICLGDRCHCNLPVCAIQHRHLCPESYLWKEPATGGASCYRKRNSQKLTALRKDRKTSSKLESVW